MLRLKIIFSVLCSFVMANMAQASGDFYTIDYNNIGKISANGAVTKCGSIPVFYVVDNLTYNTADGYFYSIYNRTFAKISATGLITEICDIQVPSDYDSFVDITYNTSDGNFYALNTNHLVKITPTGALTEVCYLGYPFVDYDKFERLCYNSADGNFYATNCNHLVKISPGGKVTEVCDLGLPYPDYDVFRCLCYNASDGFLYSINNNHLVRISTSGAVSEVCDTFVSGIDFDCLTNITWVPSQTVAPTAVSIGKIKELPVNTAVAIDDAVVTAVNIEPGISFVESSNRTSGVKLITSKQLTIGQKVKFSGNAQNVDGEYQINNLEFDSNVVQGTPIKPLMMTSRAFGRTFATKPNAASIFGLLIRYAGKVTSTNVSERFVYVNDGGNFTDGTAAGVSGIRVRIPAGAAMPMPGDILAVTGISRTEKTTLPSGGAVIDGKYYPEGTAVYISTLWPRDSADISTITR